MSSATTKRDQHVIIQPRHGLDVSASATASFGAFGGVIIEARLAGQIKNTHTNGCAGLSVLPRARCGWQTSTRRTSSPVPSLPTRPKAPSVNWARGAEEVRSAKSHVGG